MLGKLSISTDPPTTGHWPLATARGLGKLSISILILAGFAVAADSVQVATTRRVKLGGIVVSAGYTHFSGPYYPYYYGYPYAYYSPFYDWAWYNPFFHPGFYDGFSRGPGKGEIRLRTNLDKAEVYLDGAYAGLAADLKTIWLAPGAYNLELKAPQRTPYARRIYILTGKILKIDAPLEEVQP